MREATAGQWKTVCGLAFAIALASFAPATVLAEPGRAVIAQGAPTPAPTPAPTAGGNQLAAGRQIYNRACGRCHPGGEEDVGPRVTGLNWDEARMTRQIRQGSGRMRPVGTNKLADADLPAVMAYLRSLHAVR